MNHEKENSASPKDPSKKVCPRAARENAQKKPEVPKWKTAHTGLRFNFDRKKLVSHEFSFNSVSKTEKVSRCRIQEKSVKTKSNAEESKSSDTKKIKVLMDTLKISKSEGCCSREKSPLRKEMPKSPVVERLTSKKACTRCSRCSKAPKEEKSEVKTLKVAKNHEQPLKTTKKENQSIKIVKLETPQSSKTIKKENQPTKIKLETPQSPKTCKKQCSKLIKLLEETQEKPLKPKSILKHTEKSDSDEKNVLKNHDRTLIPEKAKSCSAADKGNSNGADEMKIEFAWPGKPDFVIPETPGYDEVDKGKSEILNGSDASDTVACLMNGTRHDEHLCDPHIGLESPDGTKKELESVKAVSKIPRKTDAPGPKSDASLNKSAIPQPIISFDIGFQNMKNQPAETVNVAN